MIFISQLCFRTNLRFFFIQFVVRLHEKLLTVAPWMQLLSPFH